MIDLEIVKNYLREIEVFSGKPIFKQTRTELVCVDPRGQWDEYYMTSPYWQNQPVDFHNSEFERIFQKLSGIAIDNSKQETFSDTLMERAIKIIPDSSNVLLIELGSGYGTNGAGYIAKHKPNIKALLINKGWEESLPPKYLFMVDAHYYNHDLRFTKGREFLSESNLEKRINKIYQANGIDNVTFKKMQLTENNHQEFIKDQAKGKEVYLIGIRAPLLLPFIMARMYNYLNAKAMFLAPTALEKIESTMFPWEIIQKNLGLNNRELQGYIKSVFDTNFTKNSLGDSKYDYNDPSQKRVGMAVKLGIALAIAKEVSGTVYKNIEKIHEARYNQADQIIMAQRN